MRKVIIMFALAMGIVTANAQENVTVGKDNGSEQPTLTKEVYPLPEGLGVSNVLSPMLTEAIRLSGAIR